MFNLSLKLKGFPIEETNRLLKQIQSLPEEHYTEHLESQKKAIVTYHLKHNPFYKNFAKDINPDDWNSIPVMTKRDLQQPLSHRLSEGFSKKKVFVNKTSGSSGDPFIFAKDKFCHALTWSDIFDCYGWYEIDLNKSKQARFYGIPLDKKGYSKERFKDILSKRHRFSVFDLSDTALEKCLEKFRTTKFEYLNGYTSPIVQFAKFLQKKEIVLKQLCPTLKLCMTTSEMLFEDDKTLLETQFGIPIINEYGAAELGIIAFQNITNQWIVNSEDLYVEILDENNRILPYDREGRIVVTSLYNKAHPFIRYDLGDIGTLAESSTLKTPILKHLTGRTNDIVKLPSGKKAAGLTFYYVTKTVIEDSGNVKEFVIEQTQIDRFKISYVSNNPLSDADKTNIKAAIETYLESGLTIQFERKERLNREKSGKLKQFTSFV
ncbi:phenylacetate--CoA ligase family protein [Aestuariibaculum suncheonense]